MYTELFTMYNFYKKPGLCHWLLSILSDLEKTTNILHCLSAIIGQADANAMRAQRAKLYKNKHKYIDINVSNHAIIHLQFKNY